MTIQEEEYVTLFCEGDGHVRITPNGYPRVGFSQLERSVLDYIASLTTNGHFYQNKKTGVWQLTFSSENCVPLLGVFSRHVVGRQFLSRLNEVLAFVGMPLAVQHPLTLEGFVAFWDAEGSSCNNPTVSVIQKNREILDLIVEMSDGGISLDKDSGVYHWNLMGKKARKLYKIILEKSHCPVKAEALRRHFEEDRGKTGKAYRDTHKDEQRVYRDNHRDERKVHNKQLWEEQKRVREWMKAHPDEVVELKGE